MIFNVAKLCSVSYQSSHHGVIPEGMHDFQCSQAVFRKPLQEDDHRVVFMGLAAFVKLELEKRLTLTEIDQAEELYATFYADTSPPYAKPYPFPRSMFERVVAEFDGYLPIVVTGLPEGTAHYIGEPCVQVWTDVPGMGELVGWIESTMLPYLWTMSTVATRGRKRKEGLHQLYQRCYPSMTQEEIEQVVQTRFHDFGRRGAANAQLTGLAHLLNFNGSDTMDSVWTAQHVFNQGKSFGACSVAAAAHRSVTPWHTEREAYAAHLEAYGDGIVSIVADSYDFASGTDLLCEHAEEIKRRGGTLIVRPDSGDPTVCVLLALRKLEAAFGCTTQEAGLKVLNNSGIIQGDGVDDKLMFEILAKVVEAGYSPANVAFGMGEANHKALRSDMELAYKTCMIGLRQADGTLGYRSVMKASNSQFKKSIPCPVSIVAGPSEGYRVRRQTAGQLQQGIFDGILETYYDGRERNNVTNHGLHRRFEHVRSLALATWDKLAPIPQQDTFEPVIREMQEDVLKEFVG